MKMKRYFSVLCACALLLTGCAAQETLPEQAADGTPWDEGWTAVGGILGVEAMDNGLTLRDTNSAIAASGMYYALWAVGEPQPFTNADGDGADLYDAQLAVVVSEQKSPGDAEKSRADWVALAEEHYQITARDSQQCNGADYTVLEYTCQSEGNPYARGASAFGVYGDTAVCMELSCLDSFTGDETEYLSAFLAHSHYAAQKGD